ncbi:MAG: hypothetical protein K0S63_236 [Gammaproteobacteria bacterium]|jgi:chitinase|nr:hypothetical protein [Gammaproteobacteria bacterium]
MKYFKKIISLIALASSLLLFSSVGHAATKTAEPAPNPDMKAAVTLTPDSSQWWSGVNLNLSYNPASSGTVDVRNATITFDTHAQVSSIWGSFEALDHAQTELTSVQEGNVYRNTVKLIFAAGNEHWVVKTLLNKGEHFTLHFGLSGAADTDAIQKSVNVFTGGVVQRDGSIQITAPVVPGEGAGMTVPVDVTGPNGTVVSLKDLQWSGSQTMMNLSYGSYTITPKAVGDYTPPAPQTVVLSKSNKHADVVLGAYTPVQEYSVKIKVSMPQTAGTQRVDVAFSGNRNYSFPVTSGIETPAKVAQGTYTVAAPAVTVNGTTYEAPALTVTVDSDGITINLAYAVRMPSNGRVIGFLASWSQPYPTADQLSAAGYTHIMVAFGVFSTTNPGVISEGAFAGVTPEYINSLHAKGIKVLLSLGGASSGIPNTTVDFNAVRTHAGNDETFKTKFLDSIENLVQKYGFDGIDIDIEHGLNPEGSFTAPTGDIAVLASILNTLHAKHPNLLITLTPQVANVRASNSFSDQNSNYAALIMQTHAALSWVGIQLYNAGNGCAAWGIDGNCYDSSGGNSSTFSVVMATALLQNWPQNNIRGFLPYISHLKPEQVVLGYPAPDRNGNADGTPVTYTTAIKQAISCLSTGKRCDGYTPPKVYGPIGGVFQWELSHDQNNDFRFAKDLSACVKQGQCD